MVIRNLIETIGMLILLPAILAHEATHWIASRSISDELQFELNPSQPAVLVNWSEDVPIWRIRVAKVAPTIVGILVTPFVIVWLLRSYENGLASILLVVVLWAVYTMPSRGDLSPPS